jgi:mannose-6-phosphate isomerase-like protein (cupin superfamily)
MRTKLADNILRTFLHVRDDASIKPVDAPDSFWPDMAAGAFPELDQGRLMSAFTFSAAWDSWERHPTGEELVMLLAGAVTLTLEEAEGPRSIQLGSPGEYALIPRNTWHTATTAVESTLLFLTPGAGTEHRPIQGSEIE